MYGYRTGMDTLDVVQWQGKGHERWNNILKQTY